MTKVNIQDILKSSDSILSPLIIIIVSLLYNGFFHKLTQVMYGRQPFDQNRYNSIVTLITIGIASLIFYKLVEDESIDVKINKNILKSIKYGGLLLIFSGIMNNWTDMNETIKLLLIGLTIGGIFYLTKE